MGFPLSMFGTSAAAGGGGESFPQNYVYNAPDCRLQSVQGNSSVKSADNMMLLMSFWVQGVEASGDEIKLVGMGVGDGTSDSMVEVSIESNKNPAGLVLKLGADAFPLYDGVSTDKFDRSKLNHFLVAWSGTLLQVYLNDQVLTMPGVPFAIDILWSTVNTTSVGAFVGDGGTGGGGPQLGVAAYGSIWAYAGQYLDLSVEANRRLFINPDLGPVDLGANGEIPLGTPPDIYFGGSQVAADWNAATNLGDSPGLFRDGSTLYTEAPPPATYFQNVVVNNGAGLRNQTGALAPAPSNQFVFSAWLNNEIVLNPRHVFISGVTTTTNTQVIDIALGNGSSTLPITILLGDGVSNPQAVMNSFSQANYDFSGPMHHLLISRDGPNIQVYLDDVAVIMNTFGSTDAALPLDTCVQTRIGMRYDTTTENNIAKMADFWFQAGLALNLSVEANRRLFIDQYGRPVDLGDNGAIPSGTTPNVFFGAQHLAVDWNAGDNIGTQTDYGLSNGPFTDQ